MKEKVTCRRREICADEMLNIKETQISITYLILNLRPLTRPCKPQHKSLSDGTSEIPKVMEMVQRWQNRIKGWY
jgi:hypothetical protein